MNFRWPQNTSRLLAIALAERSLHVSMAGLTEFLLCCEERFTAGFDSFAKWPLNFFSLNSALSLAALSLSALF